MNNTPETRLEETQQELQHLREILKKTQERLGEADNALLFYSKFLTYGVSPKAGQSNLTYQNLVKDDFDQAVNDTTTLLAGRRARDYFKKYE